MKEKSSPHKMVQKICSPNYARQFHVAFVGAGVVV